MTGVQTWLFRSRVAELARERGYHGLKVAAVVGDDVTRQLSGGRALLDDGRSIADLGPAMISANAYLGSFPIARALDEGAHVVSTGRTGDPALFVGPMIHSFGWAEDDWDRLGRGTAIGHLLECAGQLTGGYFADPGYKDVPGLARLGFPIGEVSAEGVGTFSKVAGSGGELSIRTCTEQLLYEIFDPASYVQPDVIELAASYGFGIARNHPFIDGNKRTAFVAVELFLDLNGYELTAIDADCVLTMLALASSEIDEAAFANWIRNSSRLR